MKREYKSFKQTKRGDFFVFKRHFIFKKSVLDTPGAY